MGESVLFYFFIFAIIEFLFLYLNLHEFYLRMSFLAATGVFVLFVRLSLLLMNIIIKTTISEASIIFFIVLFFNIEYVYLVRQRIFISSKFLFLFKSKKVIDVLYVLDASSLLDKRIIFLLEEEILIGIFIIPDFIIDEVKKIAVKDPNKSKLVYSSIENIKNLQKKVPIILKTTPGKKRYRGPIDERILHFAKDLGAIVLTNDFELYQKAKLYHLKSININVIANNMKVSKLPGDIVEVKIVKEGKEPGQGVGYLEDGTMVVVKDAYHHMGEKLTVKVTSIIQTQAGRILFGEIVQNNELTGDEKLER